MNPVKKEFLSGIIPPFLHLLVGKIRRKRKPSRIVLVDEKLNSRQQIVCYESCKRLNFPFQPYHWIFVTKTRESDPKNVFKTRSRLELKLDNQIRQGFRLKKGLSCFVY